MKWDLQLNKWSETKLVGQTTLYAELLQATDEFSVDKITEIENDMYNSGNIPEDLSKSIFILFYSASKETWSNRVWTT